MYLHTDFVTRFPIIPGQNVMLFFIQPTVHTLRPENMTYTDTCYEPVSLPFIAKYGEHGDFIVDTSHSVENTIAWRLLCGNSDVPSTISEQTYHSIVQPVRDVESLIISVTDYDSYQRVTKELMHQPVRQGVFTRDVTYAEQYEQAVASYTSQSDNLPVLVQPNMRQYGRPDYLDPCYRVDQQTFAKLPVPSIHRYFMNWRVFQAYLELIRVPFGPVMGLGDQVMHLDMYALHVEQVQSQIKHVYSTKIQQAIEFDYMLDPEEYEAGDVPEFVDFYTALVQNRLVLSGGCDENDAESIRLFCEQLSLDDCREWARLI